jgi:hypothetical protein
MIRDNSLMCIGVCLIFTIFIAGCTSPSASPPLSTATPTTVIQTLTTATIEVTTVPVTTSVVTKQTTESVVEKEILRDKGILTTKTYKTYDFKDLGFKFIYPGDKFRISIKAEKPVLGYALNTEQATGLQGSQLIPQYESYSKNILFTKTSRPLPTRLLSQKQGDRQNNPSISEITTRNKGILFFDFSLIHCKVRNKNGKYNQMPRDSSGCRYSSY